MRVVSLLPSATEVRERWMNGCKRRAIPRWTRPLLRCRRRPPTLRRRHHRPPPACLHAPPLPQVVQLVAAHCASGEAPVLVGRSHECDFPPGLEALPVLTAAKTQWTNSGARCCGTVELRAAQ